MKYLKSFKLFEKRNDYVVGDTVFIYLEEAGGEPIPVKLIEKYPNSKVFKASFAVEASPMYDEEQTIDILPQNILGRYSTTIDNPADKKNMALRRDAQKISNDITINGYPKTL